jgi:1,4-dihydroxy-2-naphthoate octaprenyltransferase
MKTKPALSTWWRASRFHFVPPSFLPAIFGGVAAWAVSGRFNLLLFIITVVCVVCNHIALNMTDDYFDFKHRADRERDDTSNPYTGGSGVLTQGLIEPQQMRAAFIILYLITVAGGVFLVLMRGWPILLFGIAGMCSAYFYTAPPVRYGYHGFGELSQLVNFSITIGLGSYYVQAQQLSWEPLLAVLPLGFMMFAMITINEIPDEWEDRDAEKRNLVVLFGAHTAVWLYGGSMAAAYATVLIFPLLGVTSYWTYLSFVTFPLYLIALVTLTRHYRDPVALSPANLLTIRIHNGTGIMLIVAYIIQGALHRRPMVHMIAPLILLAVLQLPVFLRRFSPAPAADTEVSVDEDGRAAFTRPV